MKVWSSILPEVKLFEPNIYVDDRGSFQETFHADRYREAGLTADFVQHNQSWSRAGVLRGLHAQARQPQGKLVRVVHGEVYDVAVDIRPSSPRFLRWTSARLSAENGRQIWIPPGFAHGFCVIGEEACIEYKCTDFYAPNDQLTIRWDDPVLAIDWPIEDPVLSDKDRAAVGVYEALGLVEPAPVAASSR